MVENHHEPMKVYERLDAWQKSHELVLRVYQLTQSWPKNELYGLVSQTRRAALSVPINIAEGAARRGSREFRRFLDISWGSYSELSYCLRVAGDLGYVSAAERESINDLQTTVGKLLWKLHLAVRRSAKT
jgi:four helix bundle protein